MEELLQQLVDVWLRQIEAAQDSKEQKFGKTARKIWGFFGKSWDELYPRSQDSLWDEYQFAGAEKTYYRPRCNLVGMYVSTMLPYVLANVPNRLVAPRREPIPQELLQLVAQAQLMAQEAIIMGGQPPMMSPVLELIARAAPMQEQFRLDDEARAWLMQWFLQYLPSVYGLQRESEMACIEALAKGRGIVFHEMIDSPTGEVPGSFYYSIDRVFCDPDSLQWRNAGYIILEREESVWHVADKFGLNAEEIRGAYRSRQSQAQQEPGEQETTHNDENAGVPKRDICRYYEVWSRMGIGHRFHSPGDKLTELKDALETVGPYCYLAIMRGMKYPLNLPPHLVGGGVSEKAIEVALSWDLPTYENPDDPWPCSKLDFLPDTESPWATSTLEAALPFQVFIDHLYSFLMCGAARRSKSLILVAKQLEQVLKDAIATGLDMQIVPVDQSSITDLKEKLHVVDFGQMNKELWQLVPLCQKAFEEFTGISPLLTHGGVGPTQPRSAAEMTIRQERASSRPDDYADAVERWQSEIASKEGQISRLQVGPTVVGPLFGEEAPEDYDPEDETWLEQNYQRLGPLSQLWGLLVNTTDEAVAAAELNYTVEHGSGRRKNQQKAISDVQTVGQTLMQAALQVWTATGNPQPFNAFVRMVATALENDDILGMQLPDISAQLQQQQAEEAEEEQGPPKKEGGE